jgi:hypothetical protein
MSGIENNVVATALGELKAAGYPPLAAFQFARMGEFVSLSGGPRCQGPVGEITLWQLAICVGIFIV